MDLQKLTLKQVKEDLESKKYSAKEILDESIKHSKKCDEKLKVFVSWQEERAQSAAHRYDDADAVSSISGVPGTIKDIFNWKGTNTTASSNMLKSYESVYNSTVVDKLEKEDAVIFGKTNMDAFAHGSSTERSDFFTTKNPWDLNRVPGGSSGGSAAAVAAGMGIYSIGTETAGSIRLPASWCGITGLKPTYGRVSRYGVVSMGSSLDSPGPMTKNVEDAAILLEVLAGKDEKDANTSTKKVENYFANLNKDISGMKIGLPKQYFNEDAIQKEVLERVTDAAKLLEKQGAELVDMDLMDPKYGIAVYTVICRSEISSNLGRYDGIRYGYFSDEKAEEILDQVMINRGEGFGNEAKQRSMTGAYALSAGYYDAYYKKAQKVRTLIRQDLERAFEEVDIIIGPTTPTTALKLGESENNPLFGEMADILIEASTLSGCPGLNIPVGFDQNSLPVGMNLFAPQFNEQQILNVGYAYQNETDYHNQFPDLNF